ncbi:unnamed protein product [Kluyveromyces dobzhanskii CBS 2104]|uniref:WGS project CCBQ000000000 data, contig 00016 n=1 Tax=Kluyveromyces dobzhanskii CBS 2104 TaxID=1427455 RepID=A0A0A8L1Y9_9SACH|nr:unnamed protein product [Kluyveromyces dobzhanskii CBS 2104]
MVRPRVPRRRSNLSNVVQLQRAVRPSRASISTDATPDEKEEEELGGSKSARRNGDLVKQETTGCNVEDNEGSAGETSGSKSDLYESDSSLSQSQSQLTDEIPSAFLERLMSFSLFHNAPKLFYVAIARKLKLIGYHAHEFIVKAGEPALAMYWILRGSANVTFPDGEIVHAELVEGSYFGEIGILFNRPRTATVVSKTKILLGVLTAENFNQVLLHFPQIERQIRDEAQERLATQEKQRKAGVAKISHDDDFLVRKQSPSSLDHSSSSPSFYQNSGLHSEPISLSSYPANPLVQEESSEKLTEELLLPPQLPKRSESASPNAANSGNFKYMGTIDGTISTRQFLKSLPLFATLPAEIIHQLALSVEIRKVPPFEYVFRKNDYGEKIYFIISGEVEVLGPSSSELFSGKSLLPTYNTVDVVLARLGPGQYFGEMGFLNSITDDSEAREKCRRSADIRTVSSCTLLALTGETLREFCAKFPQTEDQIIRTAEERIKKNNDLENEQDSEDQDQTQLDDSVGLVAPVSRKGFIELLSQPNQLETPAVSSVSLGAEQADEDNDNNRHLFKSSFTFDKPSEKMVRQNSTSPTNQIKSIRSSSFTPVSFPSRHESVVDPTNSPNSTNTTSSGSTTDIQRQRPLELHVPPLNASLKRKNSTFSLTSPSPIQYMRHLKRVRLSNVGGGASRRRSSVLSVGPLPDRLLLRCFQHISLPELMKLRLVCRRWRQLLYVAPGLFDKLDLTPWSKAIDDKILQEITDFVGSRPKHINVSNCFHITDEGFSYMVNEIGIGGQMISLKMSSCWDISAMSIMDIAVPSIGKLLEEIDLSNCRKVRDDVIQRLIGWDVHKVEPNDDYSNNVNRVKSLYPLDEPIPGMEEYSVQEVVRSSKSNVIGCGNLNKMVLRHCKNLTDLTLYHMSLYAKDRLTYLDFTRCSGLTDVGFSYWSYQNFPNLRTLILSECIFLTDNSIRSIVNGCPNLSHLNLSFCCSLTDVAIELLCLGGQNLEELDISFCGRAVSDLSLLNISMHLRKLKKISLKGCLRATRSGVDSLLGGYAPLEKIDVSQCKNAHIYQGGIPATRFEPARGSKSVFLTMEDSSRCIQVII